MRFITEFELISPYTAEYKNAYIGRHGFDMGNQLSDSFGWKERFLKDMQGTSKNRFSLEIEAFPVDKWVDFKKELFAHFREQ